MFIEYKESTLKSVSSRTTFFAIALIFACCQASLAQSHQAKLPHSMKGYELYSWKIRGEWYFTLLVGTNRLKTGKEVSSARVRVRGVGALKKKLNRLPKGEEVSWSAGLVPQTVQPPEKMVKEVKSYCERHGIMLRVSRHGGNGALKQAIATDRKCSNFHPSALEI